MLSQGLVDQQSLFLIGRVAEKLMARNMLLGTAESCTGGLVAVLCTDIAGSSAWFAGGIVAYANHVKTGLLNVPETLLAENGAVSGPVVEAMASGALPALGVQASVAISGIAGPDGGTADKPVGTVWIAVAVRQDGGEKVVSQKHLFFGTRTEVRHAAAVAALEALDATLE